MSGINISQIVAEAATKLITETKMKVEDRAQFALLQQAKAWFEDQDGTEEEVKKVLLKVFKAAQANAARRGAPSVDAEDIKAASRGARG